MISLTNHPWHDAVALGLSNRTAGMGLCSLVHPVVLEEGSVLLFNGLNGHIDLLSCQEWDAVSGGQTEGVARQSDEFLNRLRKRAYLLYPGEEKALVAKLENALEEESKKEPIVFFVCPTQHCPMGCRYCIEGQAPGQSNKEAMTEDMVKGAFRAMKDLCDLLNRPCGHIVLFGGEPLQPHSYGSVQTCLEEAQKNNRGVFVFTNGLFAHHFEELFCKYRDVLLGISVTLDYPKAYHNDLRAIPNAFDHAVGAIDGLVAAKLPVWIRTNISTKNVTGLRCLKEELDRLGYWMNPAITVDLTPVTNHGCFPETQNLVPTHAQTTLAIRQASGADKTFRGLRSIGMYSYLYYPLQVLGLETISKEEIGSNVRVPRLYGCLSAMGSCFTLTADGGIHICNEQAGSHDTPVGHFYPDVMLSTESLSKWKDRNVRNDKPCCGCAFRFLCGGGCPLEVMRTQDYSRRSPPCAQVRSDFDAMIQSSAKEILEKWGNP